MSNQYFLRLAADPNHWEEVDRFTYDNRRKAIQSPTDPTDRYSHDEIIVDSEGQITIDAVALGVKDLGCIAKLLGAKIPHEANGFCSPTVANGVHFQMRANSIQLRLDGRMYKQA